MAYTDQVGSTVLRAEVVDIAIKGVAKASYKFKQAVSVVTTSAWKNTYFRESSGALTGTTGNAVEGIPRGANFPQSVVTWEERSAWIKKYGLEDNIYWEDILTDDLDVQGRTLYKIGEGVASAVDTEIWDGLTESLTPTNINTFKVTATEYWDGASAAVIDDLMHAKQFIGQHNYNTSNLMAFISEKDHRSIVTYLADSGAQFPVIGTEVARNGSVGRLAGIQLIVSNNVSASWALVVVPKICATWKQLVPLKTDTEIDPFKSVRIRAVEMGTLQLTDPGAVCLIEGTQEW